MNACAYKIPFSKVTKMHPDVPCKNVTGRIHVPTLLHYNNNYSRSFIYGTTKQCLMLFNLIINSYTDVLSLTCKTHYELKHAQSL